MTKQVSSVEASLQNVKVASLIKKIAQSDKAIETGGCGCGCGDACTGCEPAGPERDHAPGTSRRQRAYSSSAFQL